MGKNLSEFPIQYIKGVGPRRAKLLNTLGIRTVEDAFYYLPYRYEDRKNIKKISSLIYGHLETVTGKVLAADVIKLHKGNLKLFELTISDGSGLLKGKWFNQPFMKKNFKVGQEVILSGVVKRNPYWGIGFEIDNPEYEFTTDDSPSEAPPNAEALIHTSRMVPIYRTTAGLSVRQLRTIMFNLINACMEDISDPIPKEILERNKLPDFKDSIMNSHFPEAEIAIEVLNRKASAYQNRLFFHELFLFELGLSALKSGQVREKGIAFNPQGALVKRLLDILPFKLTAAQQRVFNEILGDMKEPHPMNRLLQGDVGCGKTVIALMAMLTAVECGYQTALMAPTEILAEQHYINIHKIIEDMGLNICLLTGSVKKRPLDDITSGRINMVVGTHALIQEGIEFKNLGLIIIDEQHRFGVMQRALLKKKGSRVLASGESPRRQGFEDSKKDVLSPETLDTLTPDVLVMTATPIPRTLAMTLYGDLDYSVIDELPPQRRPVMTRVFNEKQKDYIYKAIAEEARKGGQVYVVYPVIEESEKSSAKGRELKSAITGKEALEKMFPDFHVSLIHGRMKPQEKERVMASFKKGEIDVLVSTTVIEVGVDVPNASLMLIVHAERFGLAQLHQLRGRVGRGSSQSYCFLLAYQPYGEDSKRRLNIMSESSDGFRIAEEDLDIRGPGEFFGTRQAGLPDLRAANIVRDARLLDTARKEAFALIDKDAELKAFPELRTGLEKFWKGKIELFKTG